MSDLHPLYRWGPLGFVVVSAIASAALTPRFVRVANRLKVTAADRRLLHYGRPRRSLERVVDGETVSFIGELASSSAKRYELALEHAEDTEETVRLVPDLQVLFEGRKIELCEVVSISGGSDEVVSGTSRWRRLSVGDRVHVTGTVVLGEVEAGTFRGNARAVRLLGEPMTPVRVAYAGTPTFRNPGLVKMTSTVVSAITVWVVSSIVALLLLLLPTPEIAGRLPGDHVDATLVAHAVPPVSGWAAKAIARRLETAGSAKRYTPRGALEARLEQAAAVDPKPEDTLARWLRFGFRTRAGKVALGNPSVATCRAGRLAFAAAARVGGVAQLALSCASLPSEEGAEAAFAVGDFAGSHGPEAETIVFRQSVAPIGGAPCAAGGDVDPPTKQPLCLLLHAEMKPKRRRELLLGLPELDPFPRRWVAAARRVEGDPLPQEVRFTIDPAAFVVRPIQAIADQPLAVYVELWQKKQRNLSPEEALWVGLVVAAERSAFGHHDRALALVDEVVEHPVGNPATGSDFEASRRLATAIALRAGDLTRARRWASEMTLPADDHLLAYVDFLERPRPEVVPVDVEQNSDDWHFDDGVALADALTEIGPTPNAAAERLVQSGLPFALRAVPLEGKPALREWLREGFPTFGRAAFFARAAALAHRLDAAHALDDAEMVADVEPIVGRFEAVLLDRTLALTLRLAAQ